MNEPIQAAELTPLRRAYLAIEELQARLDTATRARHEPIAIVGAGCRLPGDADNLDLLWSLLRNGVDAITETPGDRWDIDAWYDADVSVPGKMSTRHGGFIRNVDQFDPQFFNISPREAAAMDPQQRLLLEVTWEALENAAIAPARLAGTRTGVYVAVTTNDYAQVHRSARGVEGLDAYYASGIAHSIASGRLSYVLGLEGPSLSIDTACSSSLVAIHLAVQSLRSGECRMALAGGVNLILTPELSITLSKYQMMAGDGRCKFGDARADGFVRAEGCAMVVLKRLRDALADGDPVLAVIRGSAANQDGASSGLTAPNGPSQEAVLRAALADAGVKPAEIGYIEAHGTGTALGDPIELQALGAVFGPGRNAAAPLAVGSIKTNIGHNEAVAGVAGLLKLALVLRHGEIPPSLHFATPNPLIDWEDLPLSIPTVHSAWPTTDGPRLGGVSSFGFSGTNVHMVLEEPPALPAQADAGATAAAPLLLPLSARSEAALREMADRYACTLRIDGAPILADVAFTAGSGRNHFAHRLVVSATNSTEASDQLVAFAAGQDAPGIRTHHVKQVDPPTIAFLFTGQGAQYPGMGRTLYTSEPVFRAMLDQCAAILAPHMEHPLLDLLFAEPGSDDARLLDQTACTQPALVALEIALATLWRSWGIAPTIVLGHSVGEFAAAWLAGVLSLEDTLALVAARGRLMGQLPSGGAMAALFVAPARVETLINETPQARGQVVIGAFNGPAHTVVSGPETGVQALVESCTAAGVRAQRLAVSHAFHSPLLDPMLEELEATAARFTHHAPRVRLISNLTGEPAGNEITQPAYWRRHARQPVRFVQSLETLARTPNLICIEVGPHPVLSGMAMAAQSPDGLGESLWLSSLRKGRDELSQMGESVATLYTHGAVIDWAAFGSHIARRKVSLPTYPFQRERCWVTSLPGAGSAAPSSAAHSHPLLGRRLRSALEEAQFEGALSQETTDYLRDHRVFAQAILPATAFLEMGLAAADALGMPEAPLLEIAIHVPLAVPAGEVYTLQTIVSPPATGATSRSFKILSQAPDAENWTLHVTGTLGADVATATDVTALDQLRARCTEPIASADHYARLASRGLDFGPSLRGVQQLWRGAGDILGLIELPDAQAADTARYRIHPALLDGCIQCLSGLALGSEATYLPLHIERVHLTRAPGSRVWAHATLRPSAAGARTGETLLGDVTVYDDDGRLLVELSGLLLKRMADDTLGGRTDTSAWLYAVDWHKQPLADGADGMPLLADPQAALEAARATIPTLQTTLEMARYHEQMVDLDALSTDYVVAALQQLGWQWQPGRRVHTDALFATLAIAPTQRALFVRLLGLLAEDGLLHIRGSEWEIVSVPQPPLLTPERIAALRARYPAASADIVLASRCGGGLAAVLRGAADPLQLLFPEGALAETEQLYSQSPWARIYTSLVAEAVAGAIATRDAAHPLRILEIGGGTGGTTSAVLPRLAGRTVDYCFTDISPFFLSRAQERFSEYDILRYQPLDIERDPQGQGFAPHTFDCIIAANVIHATADLRTALAHMHTLLAPGGLLVLQEMTRPLRWIDITFGMTEGWWRFSDHSLRPNYPLLDRAQWLALLAESGFGEAAAVPPATAGDEPGELPYQTVLVARATVVQSTGPLCIFADDSGVGDQLGALVAAAGRPVTYVRPGAAYAGAGRNVLLNPATDADYMRLLQESGIGSAPDGDIVYLWALNTPDAATLDGEQIMQVEERILGGALNLTRALARSGANTRLWLVTRAAQAAGIAASIGVSPAQATLWGFGKSVAREHPELHCTLVDLDATPNAGDAADLLDELDAAGREQEVALRAGERFVARLARLDHILPEIASPALDAPVELVITARGSLDNLQLRPAARRMPGPREVEIRVEAVALNFKDVLNTLGMYPGDPGQPGSECAGEVVNVGAEVAHLRPGDKVVTLAAGCMRSYLAVDADLVALRPQHLKAAELITLPIAYITAAFSLDHIGKMRAGERVLIHAAAGGVGLAAVHLALQAGLTVFATAGSPAKRAYVRSLGVENVFDSRSLDFADGVLEATEGAGVDLVLNSLAGDFAARSLATLAKGGRFLELGKRDLLTDAQVTALGKQIAYHVIDWGETALADPQLIHTMLVDVMQAAGEGRLAPLPMQLFPLASATEAFRTMAQARHIGKIVLVPDAGDATQTADPSAQLVHSDAAYLITGGMGGLGLVAAQWLVDQGARAITLMGRSAPGAAAQATIASLEAQGARVAVVLGDVARAEDLQRALAAHAGQPLRGVIHAAGALDDGALVQQEWARFVPVLAAKVQGAWNLHRLTAHAPLDFFILYSSIASLLGSAGQSNHAAANSFLDALAHMRRASGLPGLSINWGAWSEVGAAVSLGVAARASAEGMGTIAPAVGMNLVAHLLRSGAVQAGVLPVEWSRFLPHLAGADASTFFADVVAAQQDVTPALAGQALRAVAVAPAPHISAPAFLERIAQAPPQRRAALLREMVRATAGRVLALPTARIDDDAPLHSLGLDSLMAVELRNLLGSELALARRLPATIAFDYPSVAAITGYLATELDFEPAASASEQTAAPGQVGTGDNSALSTMLDSLEDLSDDEVERLLAEKMTGA